MPPLVSRTQPGSTPDSTGPVSVVVGAEPCERLPDGGGGAVVGLDNGELIDVGPGDDALV